MRPSSPQKLLSHAGVPAFLISNLTNIRYLSGIAASAGLLLVTPKRFFLFVDDRYKGRAEKSAREGIKVCDMADIFQVMDSVKECGFEADDVTVARQNRWKRKFPNTKFVQKVGVLQEFRRQKDADELRLLKKAYRITRELLRRVPSMLKPGISEERLARQLLMWALELGADGLSFDPIVAFGTHTSSPHHQPTMRTLKKGHIVQIDVGAKVRGYCADASHVYFTIAPTRLQAKVFTLLQEIQESVTPLVRSGASNHMLDRKAREILKREGLEEGFCHALGHGVGLDIHEGVILSQKQSEMKLKTGEVVTLEPGVYFPDRFGMRLETMVFVE